MALGFSTMILGTRRSAAARSAKRQTPSARLDGLPDELEFDLGGDAKRSFGARQKARHVLVGRAGQQGAQVVAFGLGRSRRPQRPDVCYRLFVQLAELQEIEKPVAAGGGLGSVLFGDRVEEHALAVGKKRVHRGHVVAHRAITKRADAARIIAEHAADRCLPRRADGDRKDQIVSGSRGIDRSRRAARLGRASQIIRIYLHDVANIFREVDDQALAERLPGGRGACSARDDRKPFLAGHLKRDGNVRRRLRCDHASRKTLIHGGVGCVAAARECIAGGVALDLCSKPFPERPPGFSNSHFPSTTHTKSG